jgi:predicted RNA-binding protein YlxR (DUF448 family)
VNFPDDKIPPHLSSLELAKILEGSLTETPHLADCPACQRELSEVALDMAALGQLDEPASLLVKFRTLAKQAGMVLEELIAGVSALPMPAVRSEGQLQTPSPETLLGCSRLVYDQGDLLRICLTRPGKGLEVTIEPVVKFTKPRSFFLYIDGKKIQSIALKNRQAGAMKLEVPASGEQIQINSEENTLLEAVFLTDP